MAENPGMTWPGKGPLRPLAGVAKAPDSGPGAMKPADKAARATRAGVTTCPALECRTAEGDGMNVDAVADSATATTRATTRPTTSPETRPVTVADRTGLLDDRFMRSTLVGSHDIRPSGRR